MPTSRKRRSEVGDGVQSMDAPGPMDPRHIPKGMHLDRAYRWCLARTTRDLRESIRRRRPITLPSLRRLFTRRWLHVSQECHPKPDDQVAASTVRHGQSMIRQLYLQNPHPLSAHPGPRGIKCPINQPCRSKQNCLQPT